MFSPSNCDSCRRHLQVGFTEQHLHLHASVATALALLRRAAWMIIREPASCKHTTCMPSSPARSSSCVCLVWESRHSSSRTTGSCFWSYIAELLESLQESFQHVCSLIYGMLQLCFALLSRWLFCAQGKRAGSQRSCRWQLWRVTSFCGWWCCNVSCLSARPRCTLYTAPLVGRYSHSYLDDTERTISVSGKTYNCKTISAPCFGARGGKYRWEVPFGIASWNTTPDWRY
jgi:hypothetical protein